MILTAQKNRKIKDALELEKMIRPSEPRKDSSFHTKDKRDYTLLSELMNRDKIKK